MAGEYTYTLRTDDSPNPRSTVFLLASGKPAFTIWSDGRVEVGSEVTAVGYHRDNTRPVAFRLRLDDGSSIDVWERDGKIPGVRKTAVRESV